MKISVLPVGQIAKTNQDTVEVNLGNGETGVFLRPNWQRLADKQWRMEDAYVHIPWRSIPDTLPLACRLWMYFWRQRSVQPNEDVTLRQSMLKQWGFTESPETVRKAVYRMKEAGLVSVIRNGKKQLKVLLNEPRPIPKQRQKAASNIDVLSILNSPSDGGIQL